MNDTPRRSTADRHQRILDALADGPLTEAQIADAIGIRRESAYPAVRKLLASGQVRLAGTADRDGVRGRKPALFGLDDRQSRYASEREHD